MKAASLFVSRKLECYAVTGSVAFTLTGVSQPKRSGLRPLAMPKNSSAICLGDLAGLAVADHDAVDGADGRNLGGGAGEEDFVGDVEQLARNRLLGDREAQMAGDGQHASRA